MSMKELMVEEAQVGLHGKHLSDQEIVN